MAAAIAVKALIRELQPAEAIQVLPMDLHRAVLLRVAPPAVALHQVADLPQDQDQIQTPMLIK